MAGWTKLFSSIVTSSVWCEDDHTLRVWIAMLAMADSEGLVEGSVPGLANLCRVTPEQMRHALDRLTSPDPDSRTKAHEGRRIEAFDGGWKILNYLQFRDRGQAKDGSRAPYMRAYRTRNSTLLGGVTRNTEERRERLEADTDSQASPSRTSTDTPPAPKGEPAFGRFVEVFNAVYDRRVRKALLTKAEKDTLRGLVGAYGEAGACCLPLLAWAHDKQQGGGERLKQRVVSHLLRDGSRGTFQWSTLLERADSLLKDEWQYTRRVWKLARQFGLEQALEGFGAVEPPPQVATLPPMTAADLSELEEIKRRARAEVEQEQRERYQ